MGLLVSVALYAPGCGGGSSPEAVPPPLPSAASAAPDPSSAPAQPASTVPSPTPAHDPPSAQRDPASKDEPRAEAPTKHAARDERAPKDDDEAPRAAKEAGKETDKDADRGLSLYELAKRGEATLPAQKPPAPAPKPVVAPKPAAQPAPAASAAPKPSAPRGKVTVPSTARVRIDVPAALQANLDADPRMQPWLNKVVSVIDGCFGKTQAENPGARGTIAVTVTMHENERPDADLRSLPPQLSSLVACATGSLMRTKMPLFTGPEGQRHNVSLRFGE